MSQSYRPELDVSPVLGADKANYYQNLIGIGATHTYRMVALAGKLTVRIGQFQD
jgi:hypothetical protein